jgi:DNA helicase-2/ATP-dependent DNA helicase PcrA
MKNSVGLTDVLMALYDTPNLPAAEFLDRLMNVGLKRAIAQGSRSDEAIEINKMRAALMSGSLAGMTVVGLGEHARKVDRVEITTMTSSKGLEFDAVMIIGADEESIPSYQAKSDPAQIKEDRRKFYVSITRARREVHIFYSGFAIKPWGDSVYAGPSRFLKEIGLI